MIWLKAKWNILKKELRQRVGDHAVEWSLVFAAFVIGLLISMSCSTIAPATGAAAGAAVGSVLGPVGAAAGAMGGGIVSDLLLPDEIVDTPPDNLWSLLGMVVDSAFWFLVLCAVIFWILPSPVSIWKSMKAKLKNGR